MSYRYNVSFIGYADVIDHIGFTEEEVEGIADYGFPTFFIGDSDVPLYENERVLNCILDGYDAYLDEVNNNDGDEPSRNIPERILTEQQIRDKFWDIVSTQDYINMTS